MDDSEARYLIDQLNKYASWWPRDVVFLSVLAVMMASIAVFRSASVDASSLNWLMFLFIMALAFAAFLVDSTTHEHYAERLKLLENYRAKYRSLPENVRSEISAPSLFWRLSISSPSSI